MPRRKTNPLLLMPELSDVGSVRALEQEGQDFLDTMEQLPDDYDPQDDHETLHDIVRTLHGNDF
jgi:hypothetical protein